jgi:hypothetical protein
VYGCMWSVAETWIPHWERIYFDVRLFTFRMGAADLLSKTLVGLPGFLNRESMPDYRTVGHPKAVELLKSLGIDGPSLDGEGKPQFVPDIQQ